MKTIYLRFLLAIAISIVATLSSFGQSESIMFSPMNKLGELPGFVDIYVEMHRCGDNDYNEVIVKIQNESNSDKTVTFFLDVMDNQNGGTFSREFTVATTSGDWILTDCESSDDLKIKLPETYHPNSTSVYLRW